MNKIVLIGNLTHDPETRSTPNGVSVCSFTIAVNRRFASPGGEKQTDFFRINAWRQLADVCSRYLAKGRKVAVIGELQARTYEAKDGTTRLSLDVSADEVEYGYFLRRHSLLILNLTGGLHHGRTQNASPSQKKQTQGLQVLR